MCQTENADARIVAANDLLRVLVDPEMARVMNYISQKLPMYLSGLPDATKNILANEVICGGCVPYSSVFILLQTFSDSNEVCQPNRVLTPCSSLKN